MALSYHLTWGRRMTNSRLILLVCIVLWCWGVSVNVSASAINNPRTVSPGSNQPAVRPTPGVVDPAKIRLTQKADLRLDRQSLQVRPREVSAGQTVDISVLVFNADSVARNRVRVRFSCEQEQRDVFVDLPPGVRKQVRARLTVLGPDGRKIVKAEVNPLHRELVEGDYDNNQGTVVIQVIPKRAPVPSDSIGKVAPIEEKSSSPIGRPLTKSPRDELAGQQQARPLQLKISPSPVFQGREYFLTMEDENRGGRFSSDISVTFDDEIITLDRPRLVGRDKLIVKVRVADQARPGRHKVFLNFRDQSGAAIASHLVRVEGVVEVGRSLQSKKPVEAVPPLGTAKIPTPSEPVSVGPVAPIALEPTSQPFLTSIQPNRWQPGESYQVILKGSDLQNIDTVSFGPRVKVSGLQYQRDGRLQVNVTVDKKSTAGACEVLLQEGDRRFRPGLKAWIIDRIVPVDRVPTLVWQIDEPVETVTQGEIYLEKPQWRPDREGFSAPVPGLNDRTVFTWYEKTPGLAEHFEVRFLALDGTLLLSKQLSVIKPLAYQTAFKPDNDFIVEVMQRLSAYLTGEAGGSQPLPSSSQADGMPHSTTASTALSVSQEYEKQLTSTVTGMGYQLTAPPIKPGHISFLSDFEKYLHENEINLLWQVVGYKDLPVQTTGDSASGTVPGSSAGQGGIGQPAGSGTQASGATFARIKTERVPIEISEQWPLKVSTTLPTGVSCDADNQLKLSAQTLKDSEDPNNYPGDPIVVRGTFSIGNSPWAISANTSYNTVDGYIQDDSYAFNNIIIDWGDGVHWNRVTTKAVEGGLPGWGSQDRMSFEAQHSYQRPGTYQVRLYVVPEDEMDQVGKIVAANGYRAPAATASVSSDEPILLAATGMTGGAYLRSSGIPGADLRTSGPPQLSGSAGDFLSELELIGSNIFMLYCNPLDITIVQDTAATGPLHLDSIAVTSFSADLAASLSAPGLRADADQAPVTDQGASAGAAGQWTVSSQGGLQTDLATNLTQATPGYSAISMVGETTVSTCSGGLWARGVLRYFGQGYVRLTWFVDDLPIENRLIRIGPSQLRQDLGTGDGSSWGEALISEYLLDSPRLPVQDTGRYRVRVVAAVAPDPTMSLVNAVSLEAALDHSLRQGDSGAGSPKVSLGQDIMTEQVLPPSGSSPGVNVAFLPGAAGDIVNIAEWKKETSRINSAIEKVSNKVAGAKWGFNAPPYVVSSAEKGYTVQEESGDMPCRLWFTTTGGDFEVCDLHNLQVGGDNRYSGSGLFIYRLPDGPYSSAEHYLPLPFSSWQVSAADRVEQGSLKAEGNVRIDSLPGVQATVKKLEGEAGKELRAVMDLSLKDTTLRLAGSELPQAWSGVAAPLTTDGDWYAEGLSLGRSRLGWSAANIESTDVRIDFSRSKGESPFCGSGGTSWVGVHLGAAHLFPYAFDLTEITVPVGDWSITDNGLCGQAVAGGFSHVFGEGSIGWDDLRLTAANGRVDTRYSGFYVELAWPRIRLSGGEQSFSSAPGAETAVQLNLDLPAEVEEDYGGVTVKYFPKSFTRGTSGWGLQTDAEMVFKDGQGEVFAGAVPVNDLLFTIFSDVEYRGPQSLPLNISSEMGGADQLISAVDIRAGGEGESKLSFDFTSEFSLEELGKAEEPVHFVYGIRKSAGQAPWVSKPRHPGEIRLVANFPDTNTQSRHAIAISYQEASAQVADNGYSPLYAMNFSPGQIYSDAGGSFPLLAAGGSMGGSVAGGGCGNDTFGGTVDVDLFGDVRIAGTFRFGKDQGSKYWLSYFKGDNLGIPIFPSIFLEMALGGLAYNFKHDAFRQTNGFNACPSPGMGVLFSSGLGISVVENNVLRLDGVMTIHPNESYYELLGRARLFAAADIHGRLRYWQSAFDGHLWGDISLLGGNIFIRAPEGSCGIHLDSGAWHFHAGTKSQPVTGELLEVINGKAYLMLGNKDGFKVGAEYEKGINKSSGGFGVEGHFNMFGAVDIYTGPLRLDGAIRGHIGGKFINPIKDIGLGVGADAWLGCCSPVKLGFGFSVGCCCVEGGAKIPILPSPGFSPYAEWTCGKFW